MVHLALNPDCSGYEFDGNNLQPRTADTGTPGIKTTEELEVEAIIAAENSKRISGPEVLLVSHPGFYTIESILLN